MEATSPTWLTAFLDFRADSSEAGVAFWQDVTDHALSPRRGPGGEFATLLPADADAHLRVQRLAAGEPHLDLARDDRDAEATRHQQQGTRVVHRTAEWTVLTDPTGWAHCITDRDSATGVAASR